MKKKFLVLSLLVAMITTPMLNIFAVTGSIDDHRVRMIYWDRYDWNVFYTGVTNKLNYNQFRPCVGVKNAGFECGDLASQSQYQEFGLSIRQGNHHVHLLVDKDWYKGYYVE